MVDKIFGLNPKNRQRQKDSVTLMTIAGASAPVIVDLLIDKGIITIEEYWDKMKEKTGLSDKQLKGLAKRHSGKSV